MASIFSSASRRQKLERKQAVVSALLATLTQTSKSESKLSTPEDYFAVFEQHYSGDALQLPKERLGKGLRMLVESKRLDEYQRKLEKKKSTLERKLSAVPSTAASTKSGASIPSETTLVDSSDEEEGKSKSSDEDGAPLALTWTWSALGEAF
jgi:hypothetical protein